MAYVVPAQKKEFSLLSEARLMPGLTGAIHDSVYGNAHVRVVGFGRYYPDRGTIREQNWSLNRLKLSARLRQRSSLVRYLPDIVKELGIKDVLAPSPVRFNGEICSAHELNTIVMAGSVALKRGVDADGCELLRGQGLLITAGGCAVGWMSVPSAGGGTTVGAAHCGLKSVERGVIPNLVRRLGADASHLAHAHAGYAFPIAAHTYEHRWSHPEWGAQNKLRCHTLVEKYGPQAVLEWDDPHKRKLGRIDLGFIIRAEFKSFGIDSQRIHGTPSYDALDEGREQLWYTTRGRYKKRRNLILIQHCW